MKPRPLRFCLITTFYPPYNFGGDGIYVHRLANELGRRGHRVEVVHCRDSYRLLAGREPAAPYNDHPHVTVHGLKSPWGPLSPLATHQTGYPLFKAARLRQILATGFDVIHYHNISLVGGPKILEYGQGIKLYNLHEYWLVCPTHTLFRFNRAPCRRPYCVACSLLYRRPPQWWRYSGLLKRAIKQVDAFLAPTAFARDLHRQWGLAVPFVSLPHFVPAPESVLPELAAFLGEAAPKKPYFLFAGRLEKLKGLQTLIPIFRHYPKALLLVAGSGTYEPELRHLAQGSDNIRFLGYLTQPQLQAVCRQAVALLVPSLNYEIMPLVIPEAMRLKTPVVVRNLGGMPEVVAGSGGGLVYDTEAGLVNTLDRLLTQPSLRQELGRRGHEAYQRQWTPEAFFREYFRLIEEVSREKAARAQREEGRPD